MQARGCFKLKNKSRSAIWLLTAVLLCPLIAAAATPPGTQVDNTAVVALDSSAPESSNVESFTVQEFTDVSVTALSVTPVDVASPSQQQFEFEFSHLGNGQQAYQLSLDNNGSDDFDITDPQLWLDDGDGVFEPMEDQQYDPANLPELAPGETQRVFVFVSVPSGLSVNDIADIEFVATADDLGDAKGTPGAQVEGGGDGGTDLIVGANGGRQAAAMQLQVSNTASLEIQKSVAAIEDPQGGEEPVPGAHITYQLLIEFSGEGLLNGIVLADDIPANTEYRAGSLQVGAVAQSDANDSDVAHYDSADNRVVFNLGDVSVPSANVILEFQVTIQ